MTKLLERQKSIVEGLSTDFSVSRWRDWQWQMKHSIRDIATFERLVGVEFRTNELECLEHTLEKFPLSITPYYLSLIDPENLRDDPIFKQAFPSCQELDIEEHDILDPLHEDQDSPAAGITHRYPDRVLFHISNTCAMYCRHCTRKRKVGDIDFIPSREEINKGLDYIRATPVVRDVLLSGGDPFMLSNQHLNWILSELRQIPHVEVIRIGTRIPAVLPFRVTDDLVAMLQRYQPLWINTQFNHPRELTVSATNSLHKLADAGIPLGNQSVLLANVNDCPRIMKRLMHKLVANRVRPYYLYQCDLSEGLSHFRTPIGKGIEIIESLIGHTSGFAVPRYVIDAPGGGGKIPVMPNYIISWSTNKVVLRNYEGLITTYKEPDDYKAIFCDRNCSKCHLQLKLESADEIRSIGIERLLCDHEDTISLVPEKNERMQRRKNGSKGNTNTTTD